MANFWGRTLDRIPDGASLPATTLHPLFGGWLGHPNTPSGDQARDRLEPAGAGRVSRPDTRDAETSAMNTQAIALDAAAELLARFESLGGVAGQGGAFAAAQRTAGLSPDGLLAEAEMPETTLIHLLQTGLEPNNNPAPRISSM